MTPGPVGAGDAGDAGGADLAEGLAKVLSETWGTEVEVANLAASSAGARRRNVAFDATPNGLPAAELVVTVVPRGALGLNSVTAEAQMRRTARDHGVPVPEVIVASEDESTLGGPFFISERVAGETVPRRVLRLVQQTGIGELLAGQLGTALARLHHIDPADAPDGMIDPGSRPPSEAALGDLETSMRDLGLLARPALALGMKWLERRLPGTPERLSVVHTDVRNGNLIVGADGLRAVLDWEGARRHGDPMEDLAWPALRMWRFREDHLEVGGFAAREPLVDAYRAAGGDFDEERMEWWKVLGTLRWAVGLYAQAAAHLSGTFPSIVMAASGRRVAEMEWDLLMLIRP
ncbi:MAG: phosphotransferase family protein [Acidimicrobiales bacterium]